MYGSNQTDRRDYDISASEQAQENFNTVATSLESLLDSHDADVKAAMAEYYADGVSDEYAAKEQRWNTAAQGVRDIISVLRGSLGSTDESARTALDRAKIYVQNIG